MERAYALKFVFMDTSLHGWSKCGLMKILRKLDSEYVNM